MRKSKWIIGLSIAGVMAITGTAFAFNSGSTVQTLGLRPSAASTQYQGAAADTNAVKASSPTTNQSITPPLSSPSTIDGTAGSYGMMGGNGANGTVGGNGMMGSTGANGTTGGNGMMGGTGVNGTTGGYGMMGGTGVNGTTGGYGMMGGNGANGSNGGYGMMGGGYKTQK
jgi:hypothetical protein